MGHDSFILNDWLQGSIKSGKVDPCFEIVSVSGSFSEKIVFFVGYHIKDLVWKHPVIYTLDFLRCLESEIKELASKCSMNNKQALLLF